MNAIDNSLASAQQGQCLNCAAPLTGPFCAGCGQKVRLNRSLAAFFSDLLAGLFNFESRFWRTLPMLAWCPGDLTRRYVEGQRARFISPIALYLFSVFLMFAALGATGSGMDGIKVNNGLTQAVAEKQAELATLERRRVEAVRTRAPTSRIDRQIASTREEIESLQKVMSDGFSTELDNKDGAPPWLVASVRKIANNPREFMSHVQEAASKYSWALIPLSLPFMFLLFPLSRRHIFDHAVFVTYSLSFMMLLIIAGSLLVAAGAGIVVPWLMVIPPIHMYRQLKGAYSLRWWSALLRTMLLLTFAFTALLLFAGAMIALNLIA